MTKATHNGTCQCCGRLQAFGKRGIAKHGYTTEWGFFNGTCGGSDHQPLELETALNIKTAQAIRDFADKLEAKAAGDIVEVPVRKRESDLYGRRRTVTEMMDRAQFEATQPYYSKFDSAVESYRSQLERQAANLRREADDLEQLGDKVHGQPLKARAEEAPLRRERVAGYRNAFARCEDLKAQGKRDVRQRRESYSQNFAITYRD